MLRVATGVESRLAKASDLASTASEPGPWTTGWEVFKGKG